MKQILLTKGKVTLVDNEDFDFLNQWKWNISTSGYANRSQYIKLGVKKYGSKVIRMHRLINNTPDGFFTDHINQNKLDNRKSNLRTVTKSQNGFNRPKQLNNSSGVKGVTPHSQRRGWTSEIMIQGKRFYLGYFTIFSDAVNARKKAEQTYHAI